MPLGEPFENLPVRDLRTVGITHFTQQVGAIDLRRRVAGLQRRGALIGVERFRILSLLMQGISQADKGTAPARLQFRQPAKHALGSCRALQHFVQDTGIVQQFRMVRKSLEPSHHHFQARFELLQLHQRK